jgi:hypothetical protein
VAAEHMNAMIDGDEDNDEEREGDPVNEDGDELDLADLGPEPPSQPIIAIEAHLLHRGTEDEALAVFDEIVGTAADWGSRLVRRTMGSDFERDRVIEAGHWMLMAKRLGFAEGIRKRLKGARKLVTIEIDPNDQAHTTLHQELAPAMAVHYFTGIGWSYIEWEPRPERGVDIVLAAPTGERIELQVKAPDRPGYASQFGIHGGEVDRWVREKLAQAADKLPPSPMQPQAIVITANRRLPLSGTPHVVTRMLLGGTIQHQDSAPVLDESWLRENRRPLGKFHKWPHVGAVVLLDYRRGADRFDYSCTVILNPWADPSAACRPEWFPHSRILYLDCDKFRWLRGAPMGSIPDGTPFVSGSGGVTGAP